MTQQTIDILNTISYFIGFCTSFFVLISLVGFYKEVPTKLVTMLIFSICFATFIGLISYYFRLDIQPYIRALPFDIAIIWIAIYVFTHKKIIIAERRNK